MKRKSTFLKLALLAGLLTQTLLSTAQVINTEQDKKYMPNESSLFNTLHKKNESGSNSSEVEIQNSVKFCPTMLFRQKIYFEFERQIVEGLSFTAGAGKAFGPDVIQNTASFLDLSDFDYNRVSASASEILTNSSYASSGPLLQAGLKFYYSGTTFDGGFVEFKFRREAMDYNVNSTIGNYSVQGIKTASFKMNAFMFGYGYTVTSGKKKNVTHEFFMNMGIKLFKFTKYERFEIPNGTYNTTYAYRRTSEELSFRILPSFNFGYIFGIGF